MATKFYKCSHCGNVAMKMIDSGVPLVCCGEEMAELTPNSVDTSSEKHVPIIEKVNDCIIKVEVGSIPHPMNEEHHIEFVYLETEHGGINVHLNEKPEAKMCVCTDKPVMVYDYCNLHGLWNSEF